MAVEAKDQKGGDEDKAADEKKAADVEMVSEKKDEEPSAQRKAESLIWIASYVDIDELKVKSAQILADLKKEEDAEKEKNKDKYLVAPTGNARKLAKHIFEKLYLEKRQAILAKYPGKEMEARIPVDVKTFIADKNRSESYLLAISQIQHALIMHWNVESIGKDKFVTLTQHLITMQ